MIKRPIKRPKNSKKSLIGTVVAIGTIVLAVLAGYFVLGGNAPVPERTLLPAPTPATKSGDTEEIRTLLDEQEWVQVIVTLEGNEFTDPNFQNDTKKKSEVRKIQNSALANLDENDFRLQRQFEITAQFSGEVSSSGMDKLLSEPVVKSITIDRPVPPL